MGAPGVAQPMEAVHVHLGEALVVRLGAGALEFLARQDDEVVEVLGVPLLEQIVRQHRDERRRQRDRHAVRYAVRHQPLEDLQQRQVSPGDGLVQPALLHDRRVLGVADEREVRVQDESEIPGGHRGHSSSFGVAGRGARIWGGLGGEAVLARTTQQLLARAARHSLAGPDALALAPPAYARSRPRACHSLAPRARHSLAPLGPPLARHPGEAVRWRRGTPTGVAPARRRCSPPRSSLAPRRHPLAWLRRGVARSPRATAAARPQGSLGRAWPQRRDRQSR